MHCRSLPHNRPVIALLSGLLVSSMGQAAIASPGVATSHDVQVGRYQSMAAGPEAVQVDLLSAVITHQFDEDIRTVGEAVEDLLEGSGYRLLSAKLAETFRVHLFALPLPDVQRQLGPITRRDALELLSGEAFRLVVDPVYRLVSFELIEADNEGEGDDAQP